MLTACLLATVVAAPPAPSSAPPPQWQQRSFEAMSTRIDVTLPGATAAEADVLTEVVRKLFADVEARMNEWRPDSPLGKVNAAAGDPTPIGVPFDLFELLRRGKALGELTDGAFDITWAAMWGLWDFRAKAPVVPPADEIARRAKLVDYRRLELDAGRARLPEKGMKVGLGGIAKGYALDQAAAHLRDERGRRRFLLSGGGQVYAAGAKDDAGTPWRVGIRDPRGKGADDWFAFLDVTDASVSTSGVVPSPSSPPSAPAASRSAATSSASAHPLSASSFAKAL